MNKIWSYQEEGQIAWSYFRSGLYSLCTLTAGNIRHILQRAWLRDSALLSDSYDPMCVFLLRTFLFFWRNLLDIFLDQSFNGSILDHFFQFFIYIRKILRGAEPIPAISRSKRATLVKITLAHSKVPKAIICFLDYSRMHIFNGRRQNRPAGPLGIGSALQ